MTDTTAATKNNTFNPQADWPGSLSLLTKAFAHLKYNTSFVWVYVGVPMLLALIMQFTDPMPAFKFDLESVTSSPTLSSTGELLSFLGILISLVLIAPAYVYALRASRQQDSGLEAILNDGLRKLILLIGLGLVELALVFVGLLLLVIPGIIIMIRLTLAPYIMLDKNLGPIESIKESWRLTKSKFWKVFCYVIVAFIVTIVAAILAGLIPVVGQAIDSVVVLVLGIVCAWLYQWANAHTEKG